MAGRKINECFKAARRGRQPEPLFDVFWREGEIAIMFGPQGCGKSLLAVQIAEAAARGRGIEGFKMPRRGRRVMYVDLTHTDGQFTERYEGGGKRQYRFSDNLYRERPPEGRDLAEWLSEKIRKDRLEAVVIDDLSAVKATFEGTRETVRLMRDLKAIRNELGTAILVLAETARDETGGEPKENDLGRSRILCSHADSVFGLKRAHSQARPGRIVLTRSRNVRLETARRQTTAFTVEKRENGFLGLEFSISICGGFEPEQMERIRAIYSARREGRSFRQIGCELGISKTTVHSMYGRITDVLAERFDKEIARMEAANRQLAVGREQLAVGSSSGQDTRVGSGQDTEFFPQRRKDAETDGREQLAVGSGSGQDAGSSSSQDTEVFPQRRKDAKDTEVSRGDAETQAPEPERRTIYDLERDYDNNLNEIYVEDREAQTGKPIVWYLRDRKGDVRRMVRKPAGIYVDLLGNTPYLPRGSPIE